MGNDYEFTSEEIGATYQAEGNDVTTSVVTSKSNTETVTMQCTVVTDMPSGLKKIDDSVIRPFLREMVATDERSQQFQEPSEYNFSNDDKKAYQCTSAKATNGPIVVVAYKVTLANTSGQHVPFTLAQTYRGGERFHFEDYTLLEFTF